MLPVPYLEIADRPCLGVTKSLSLNLPWPVLRGQRSYSRLRGGLLVLILNGRNPVPAISIAYFAINGRYVLICTC